MVCSCCGRTIIPTKERYILCAHYDPLDNFTPRAKDGSVGYNLLCWECWSNIRNGKQNA